MEKVAVSRVGSRGSQANPEVSTQNATGGEPESWRRRRRCQSVGRGGDHAGVCGSTDSEHRGQLASVFAFHRARRGKWAFLEGNPAASEGGAKGQGWGVRGEDSRWAVTERVKPHGRGLGASAVPGLLAHHLWGTAQRLQCSRRAQGPFRGQCTRHTPTLHLHVF